jgi:multiple sugar transport system substrate-binding protein
MHRLWLVVAAWAVAACTLPAWLGGEQASLPILSNAPAPQPTVPAVRLHFQLWQSTAEEERQMQAFLEAFAVQNPTMAITLTVAAGNDSEVRAMLARNPPDVFVAPSFALPDLVQQGLLAPLDEQASSPATLPSMIQEAIMIDGRRYCAPRDLTVLALQFNKAAFDAAGLAYPSASWTWAELRAAAESLTNNMIGVYGLVLNSDFSRWLPFLFQAGGRVLSDDGRQMAINSAEAQAALTFFVEMVQSSHAATPQAASALWPGEALGNGKAAMAIEGNWIVPYMAENFPQVDYGVAELPAGAQGKATLAFLTCYVVSANSQELAAAHRLVAHLTHPASAAAWWRLGLSLPIYLEQQADWRQQFPEQAAFLDGLAYARLWQFPPGFSEVVTTANKGFSDAFLGVRTVEDVLGEIEAAGNDVLSR